MIKFKSIRKKLLLFKCLYDGNWDIQTLINHSENTIVDKKVEKSVLSKTYKLIYKICISDRKKKKIMRKV
jgi:hypothetical protein